MEIKYFFTWLDIIAQTTALQHTELRTTLIHGTLFNILAVRNMWHFTMYNTTFNIKSY